MGGCPSIYLDRGHYKGNGRMPQHIGVIIQGIGCCVYFGLLGSRDSQQPEMGQRLMRTLCDETAQRAEPGMARGGRSPKYKLTTSVRTEKCEGEGSKPWWFMADCHIFCSLGRGILTININLLTTILLMLTQQSSGNSCSIGTRNCRQPSQ